MSTRSQLARAALNAPKLAHAAILQPDRLADILAGLEAANPRTKYGCAKALRLIAEERPDLLYPRFDFFAALLDHKNKIFQWDAAFILSRLARVDGEDKFGSIFSKYFAPVPGPVMITAANVIRGAADLAMAKPGLADRIAAEVLKVEDAHYQTAECRNVAIGHAILSLGEFFDRLQDPQPVLRFVRKQLRNTRPATRKKAEHFLKIHSKISVCRPTATSLRRRPLAGPDGIRRVR